MRTVGIKRSSPLGHQNESIKKEIDMWSVKQQAVWCMEEGSILENTIKIQSSCISLNLFLDI